MFKLIRLEWKKNQIYKYVLKVLAVIFFISLFSLAMAFWGIARDPDTGRVEAVPGSEGISSGIELFSSMAFLILAGAMLAAFVVRPYQDKTMALMFSYPIKRQKILLSKMAAVWIFCFLAAVLSRICCYSAVKAGAMFWQSDFLMDFQMQDPVFYLQIGVKSAVNVSLGFVAMFAGIKLRSSKAVMIVSFLLILLTQANVGDVTLAGNRWIVLWLLGISFLFAGMSVYKIEQRDIL